MMTTSALTGSSYFVWEEKALCYRMAGDGSDILHILHGSVLRGCLQRFGSIYVSTVDTVRPATEQDFVDYRCQPPRDLFPAKPESP